MGTADDEIDKTDEIIIINETEININDVTKVKNGAAELKEKKRRDPTVGPKNNLKVISTTKKKLEPSVTKEGKVKEAAQYANVLV